MTGTSDARLERLFGEGAVAFRTAFDLVPDPVGAAPAFGEDETFARMRRVLLSCERLSLADDSPRARTAMSVPLMRSVIWRASTMPYPAHILRSPRT